VLKARRDILAARLSCAADGFGKTSRLHTAKFLNLSTDLPLVIGSSIAKPSISAFLPELDGMIGGGLVTLEKVKVLHYRDGKKASDSPSPRPPSRKIARLLNCRLSGASGWKYRSTRFPMTRMLCGFRRKTRVLEVTFAVRVPPR